MGPADVLAALEACRAGEELLRACAWCGTSGWSRVEVDGTWVDACPAPWTPTSHGMCDRCAAAELADCEACHAG